VFFFAKSVSERQLSCRAATGLRSERVREGGTREQSVVYLYTPASSRHAHVLTPSVASRCAVFGTTHLFFLLKIEAVRRPTVCVSSECIHSSPSRCVRTHQHARLLHRQPLAPQCSQEKKGSHIVAYRDWCDATRWHPVCAKPQSLTHMPHALICTPQNAAPHHTPPSPHPPTHPPTPPRTEAASNARKRKATVRAFNWRHAGALRFAAPESSNDRHPGIRIRAIFC
jgi:hypothetical protein